MYILNHPTTYRGGGFRKKFGQATLILSGWSKLNCELLNCELLNCELLNCELLNCELLNCELLTCKLFTSELVILIVLSSIRIYSSWRFTGLVIYIISRGHSWLKP